MFGQWFSGVADRSCQPHCHHILMLVHRPVWEWHWKELLSSRLKLVCWMCQQFKTALTMSLCTRNPAPIFWIKGETDALPCHIHISVPLWVMCLGDRAEKRAQAFEMRCYQRLLNLSYKDRVTDEDVRRKIQAAIGKYDKLLTLVKKWKLRWLAIYLEVFWLSKDG